MSATLRRRCSLAAGSRTKIRQRKSPYSAPLRRGSSFVCRSPTAGHRINSVCDDPGDFRCGGDQIISRLRSSFSGPSALHMTVTVGARRRSRWCRGRSGVAACANASQWNAGPLGAARARSSSSDHAFHHFQLISNSAPPLAASPLVGDVVAFSGLLGECSTRSSTETQDHYGTSSVRLMKLSPRRTLSSMSSFVDTVTVAPVGRILRARCLYSPALKATIASSPVHKSFHLEPHCQSSATSGTAGFPTRRPERSRSVGGTPSTDPSSCAPGFSLIFPNPPPASRRTAFEPAPSCCHHSAPGRQLTDWGCVVLSARRLLSPFQSAQRGNRPQKVPARVHPGFSPLR